VSAAAYRLAGLASRRTGERRELPSFPPTERSKEQKDSFSPATEPARPWIEKREPANQHGSASSHILDITLVACGMLQGSAAMYLGSHLVGRTGNPHPIDSSPALACQVVVDPGRMTVSRSWLVTGRGMICARRSVCPGVSATDLLAAGCRRCRRLRAGDLGTGDALAQRTSRVPDMPNGFLTA
jgi:hypothetical protein